MISILLLAILLASILIPAGYWIRRKMRRPNIICVRDELDDHTQDLAYPHKFAEMMGRVHREKETDEVVVTGLFDE